MLLKANFQMKKLLLILTAIKKVTAFVQYEEVGVGLQLFLPMTSQPIFSKINQNHGKENSMPFKPVHISSS